MKKLLIVLAVMAVMMTLLTVSINAEDLVISKDHIESITPAGIEGGQRGDVYQMFDGNINCAGGWYPGNCWAGPTGSTATVIFIDEYKINSVVFYGWSNWNGFSVTFYDAEGTETAKYFNGGYQVMDGSPTDLEISDIKAKTMVVKTESAKGIGNMSFTEFVINATHEHNYSKVQSVISEATCSLPGSAVYECVCGLTETKEIPATGEHSDPVETVIFRDGFGKPGFKGTVCKTCDTQDVVVEEIGALFNLLGYSVCTFGDHGIQLGVGINYDNMAKYTELTGNAIQFGTVVASRNTLAEGNPILIGESGLEAVNDKILMKDLTNSEYLLINSKLTFDSSFDDTQLILAVYVCIGDAIHYLGEGTTYNVVTVSYNELANPS
ncbi:MAG: hypothetical protein E7596_05480 [Ruminococcaceae bacterium]|nr:hypothetical protein [Oscillospiraceae bacterium]